MADVPDMISNSMYSLTNNKLGLPVIGKPSTDQERKAYEELYSILKPLAEVRKTYNVDPMLGRNQAAVNEELFKSIQEGVKERQDAQKSGSTSGTYTWRDMDRDALAAEKRRLEEEKRRTDAGAALLTRMDQEIQIQELINQGKKKEAEQLQARFRMEDALDRELTEAERASTDALSGRLYDMRNPAEPDLTAPAAAARRAPQREYTLPLDRLQRIGANVLNPVGTQQENMKLDRQISIQEEIRNILRGEVGKPNNSGAFFP
jgi:hypothetical protein